MSGSLKPIESAPLPLSAAIADFLVDCRLRGLSRLSRLGETARQPLRPRLEGVARGGVQVLRAERSEGIRPWTSGLLEPDGLVPGPREFRPRGMAVLPRLPWRIQRQVPRKAFGGLGSVSGYGPRLLCLSIGRRPECRVHLSKTRDAVCGRARKGRRPLVCTGDLGLHPAAG
jgi:hypothetical protein